MPEDPSPPDMPAGLEHMLPRFVAEMIKDAERLIELADAPLADLADHAHAMRGKAGMFGEARLYSLLTEIEYVALAGSRDPLPALSAQVVERAGQLAVYGRAVAAEQP